MTSELYLREVIETDLPIFFAHQLDAEANFMAAFTAKDPTDLNAFNSHWKRILMDPTTINRTIVCGDSVVGHVDSYIEDGHQELTYWIGREYWGRGLATRAVSRFLAEVNQLRPMFARAAKDNPGSLRILEKSGFKIIGEDKGFANARSAEIEEWILELSAD